MKATAEFIHQAGGEFVLPVKQNRKALFDALDALLWDQVPVAHTQTDRGHGRITTRTIQILPAPGNLSFPHVSQALLIERYVSDLAGNPLSAVAALGVASPSPIGSAPLRGGRAVGAGRADNRDLLRGRPGVPGRDMATAPVGDSDLGAVSPPSGRPRHLAAGAPGSDRARFRDR